MLLCLLYSSYCLSYIDRFRRFLLLLPYVCILKALKFYHVLRLTYENLNFFNNRFCLILNFFWQILFSRFSQLYFNTRTIAWVASHKPKYVETCNFIYVLVIMTGLGPLVLLVSLQNWTLPSASPWMNCMRSFPQLCFLQPILQQCMESILVTRNVVSLV